LTLLEQQIETRSTSPVPQKEKSRANQPGFVVSEFTKAMIES
jgi:hypothetical protein